MSAIRRPHAPWSVGLLAAALCLGLVVAGPVAFVGAVYFDDASTSADFAADVLDPATNLGADPVVIGQITLEWTATPDAYAAGYRIMRSKDGGPFVEAGIVTPVTVTTFSDNLDILGLGTYDYYVVAYYEAWNSVASNTVTCTQAALLTLCP